MSSVVGRNVYVGGLSEKIREKDLDSEFGTFGKIAKIVMKQGYGFVEFDKKEDAEQAVKAMSGKNLDGNKLIVELSQGGRNQTKRTVSHTEWRVTVDNLPSGCNWRDVKDLFKRDYVTFVDVFREGYGVAEFERFDDMRKAIRRYDGTRFQGKKISVREDRGKQSDRYKPYGSSRRRDRSRSRSKSPRDRRRRSPRDDKDNGKDNGKSDRDDRREREEKQDNKEDDIKEDNGKESSPQPADKEEKSRSRSRSKSGSKSP